jgi:sorting nexin-1/2
VRLQAIDDSLGPLGPLGDNALPTTNDLPPLPPQKEQSVLRQPAGSKYGSQPADVVRKIAASGNVPEDIETTSGPRIPPPVQPSQGAPVKRDTQPSVSVEQAAKPSFDITVGDPHKVGDLTSSHIVYLVKTKASLHFQS